MLISQAFAQTAAAQPTSDIFTQMMPLVLIFVVFYFLLFRPQQKRAKKERAMIAALRRGDKIMTKSGFFGTVAKVVNDTEVLVDLGENMRVRMARSFVSEVLDASHSAPKETGKGGKDDQAKDEASKDDAPAADDKPKDDKPTSALARLLGKK